MWSLPVNSNLTEPNEISDDVPDVLNLQSRPTIFFAEVNNAEKRN